MIELHHDRKVDSPSGTALATARLMRQARGSHFRYRTSHLEHIPGARRGGRGRHRPALRAAPPATFPASQEAIRAMGQMLTPLHDTVSRECYMPGVLLATRAVMERDGWSRASDTLWGSQAVAQTLQFPSRGSR